MVFRTPPLKSLWAPASDSEISGSGVFESVRERSSLGDPDARSNLRSLNRVLAYRVHFCQAIIERLLRLSTALGIVNDKMNKITLLLRGLHSGGNFSTRW